MVSPEGHESSAAGIQTEDERQLAELGYKQELTRAWSGFTNFAISFTIISVLAGTFTSFFQAWNAGGPVAISIGWPVICAGVLLVAVSMSELTSAFPTAGGPYWWAARLGGAGWSWFTGWFNIAGLLGIVASVAYGAAFFLYTLFGIYGLNVLGINFGDSAHALTETFLLFLVILAFVTALNIFSSPLLALLFAATNEKGITDAGGGSTAVITTALFSHMWAAKAVIIIATVGQVFCVAAGLTSAARTWYAFSRDRGIPGWTLYRRLNHHRVPLYAVLAVSFWSLVITIPALWGNKAGVAWAFGALVAICTVGLYIAYIIPVYLRWRHGDSFEPGPWTLGQRYRWINVGAMIFVALVVIAVDLP